MRGIVLRTQESTPRQYAFKVLLSGFKPTTGRTNRQDVTITGKVDTQMGPPLKEWHYTLKIHNTNTGDPTLANPTSGNTYITTTPSSFGTLTNLESLVELDVGENKLYMLDVDETEHEVVIMSSITPSPITSDITEGGIFHVAIYLKRTEALS